jgi:hypothetical protein
VLVHLSGNYQTGSGLSIDNGPEWFQDKLQLGREVAAKMAVDGFAEPVLNPNTANVRQAEGVGGDDM